MCVCSCRCRCRCKCVCARVCVRVMRRKAKKVCNLFRTLYKLLTAKVALLLQQFLCPTESVDDNSLSVYLSVYPLSLSLCLSLVLSICTFLRFLRHLSLCVSLSVCLSPSVYALCMRPSAQLYPAVFHVCRSGSLYMYLYLFIYLSFLLPKETNRKWNLYINILLQYLCIVGIATDTIMLLAHNKQLLLVYA